MACSIELCLTNVILFGAIIFIAKKLKTKFQTWKTEKMLAKWDLSPKDKVILHSVARCKTFPSFSPFGLKLETYLRLAKIPYELDTKYPTGPKGKIPWITYNGTHMGDSHLIIQFLKKKFDVTLDKDSTKEQLSAARACRIMLEDHFLWGTKQYRWVDNFQIMPQIIKMPTLYKVLLPIQSAKIKQMMINQGIGKHTPTEIYEMTEADLHTLSSILGNNKFFGGEKPCEDDCSIFGCLAQAVWGTPGSSFERLCQGKKPV
ncbi:hypothetical protein Ocin01_12724 [Orchesella cincta]|uniref:Failed axon connections n=1 Tax=Orchesella cincta TaxID=48709 RepID=A0A1D2MLS8_ORCCI|nr:hypothetical protein Ocin01_12724 [Orchesella cincta]